MQNIQQQIGSDAHTLIWLECIKIKIKLSQLQSYLGRFLFT